MPKLFSGLGHHFLSSYHAGTPANIVGFAANRTCSQLLAMLPPTPTVTIPCLTVRNYLPDPFQLNSRRTRPPRWDMCCDGALFAILQQQVPT